jgi:hypothetical protein
MITDVRSEFAAALSEVDGITGHDSTPVVMSVGMAWSRWTGIEQQAAVGLFATNWQILVICGGTPDQAEAYLNTHLSDILDALAPVAFVTSASPSVIQTTSGDLYGLVVNAVRE